MIPTITSLKLQQHIPQKNVTDQQNTAGPLRSGGFVYFPEIENVCWRGALILSGGLCERRYLASRSAVAGLRALCTATRATERERPYKEHIAAPPLAFFQETFYSRSDKTNAEYHYDQANIPN